MPSDTLRKAQALARQFKEEEALRLFILRHIYVIGPAVLLSFCLSLGVVVGATMLAVKVLGMSVADMRWIMLPVAMVSIVILMAVKVYAIFAWAERRYRIGEGARFDREWAIAGVLVLILVVLVSRAPIAQPDTYHYFADARTLLGMANFWNVLSNLPFLLIGAIGLHHVLRRREGAVAAWVVLFVGTALVFFGSSYYHLNPNNVTLAWDRIPIGIAFMGFFVALVAEHTGIEGRLIVRYALVPLTVFSALSVWWWRVTGDLSVWVWIQLGPMLAVPLVLWLLPGQWTHRRYYFYALACYVVAKLFEVWDHRLMEWTDGLVSGHPLKHIAAAAGVVFFYLMLVRRKRLDGPLGG